MRLVRSLFVLGLASAVVTVVACQEPTQVTIDIRLDTARCSEVHGTAINVGVRPSDTEEKVKSRFPTAQTTDCDQATSRIGTLVITPNDEERGAVIVVMSYGPQRDPTECQPPDYKDCIVARRQFSFTKHRRLSLPMTLDPTCVNVPCDAFSTCRKGFCFSAESAPCEGADCLEPGETTDGRTDPDAAILPDVSTDAPIPVAACEGTTLRCGAAPCAAGTQCCVTSAGASCRASCGVQYCCTADDCGGKSCLQPNGLLPTNLPDGALDPDGDSM